MTKMTQAAARKVSKELQIVLDKFAAEHGMTIEMNPGTLSNMSFTNSLKISLGNKDESQEAEFDTYAALFGLTGQFGKTFKAGRKTYRLVGIKPNRPKYPIIAECVKNGDAYKFTKSAVSSLSTKDDDMFGLR